MTTTKPLVAVVDDDRSVVKSLARLLRSAGYEVGAFRSAREFLGSLATSMPQCLVLDVHMPEMNGFELETKVRELGHRLPVVFITAHDTPQTRQHAHRAGTFGLLLKPFGSPALLDAVRTAVEAASVPHPGP